MAAALLYAPAMKISPQDAAAALVALVITIGIIALAWKGATPPPELSLAYGAAITWLFVRSTQPPHDSTGKGL